MSKRRSPRGKGKQIKLSDKANEDHDECSEDDTNSERSRNRSYDVSTNSSYLNISARSGLGHHSDSYAASSPEIYKCQYPKLDTSTSSNNDSLDGTAAAVKTSKSPTTLYPSLDKLKSAIIAEESCKSMDKFDDRLSEVNTEKNKASGIYIIATIASIILIFALFVTYMFSHNTPVPSNDTVLPFDKFLSHIKNLEQIFPKQNKHLWRTVKSSAKHVLNETSSKYPVVILMAANADHAHVSRCIASKIASSFDLTKEWNPLLADINDLQNLDPGSQKQKLDEHLISAFDSNQRKSFIIDNLQLLHPEAALLLHGYCDGDNAPYKDVMIVLLLHINERDMTDNNNNAAVENYLDQLWNRGLDVDKVKALLSRVANNIVTVELENDVSVKACQ